MSEPLAGAPTRVKCRTNTAKKSEDRLFSWLVRVVIMLAVAVFMVLAVYMYQYFSKNNEAPRSYYDLQLRIWQAAVDKSPKNPANHDGLGYIYYSMGNNNRALSEFQTALSYDSKNVTAFFYQGQVYNRLGNTVEALKNYNQAVKYAKSGDRFVFLYEIGNIYKNNHMTKQAIDYYRRSIADNPIMWNTHLELGRLLDKQGKNQEALQEYQAAAKFNPTNEELQKAIKRLSGTH